MAFNPRWYQREAVDSLFEYFDTHGGTGSDGKPVQANPLVCLPTGTGKSVVIGGFIIRAMGMAPRTRIMMLTHVKELIEQNAGKLQAMWPLAPIGVYSAGLGSRDMAQPIIFGGVKSVVGPLKANPRAFGVIDLLVIDECHLIPGEGDSAQYLKVIEILQSVNPYLKVIGLTATPYRLGLGLMTNGQIFTDIAYDLTDLQGFNRLMAEGYLAPLIVPSRDGQGQRLIQIDTSGIGKSNGDFNAKELEDAAAKVTYKALQQSVELGWNRKSWLCFAAGVKHAEMTAELLDQAFGIPTVVIHSKRTQKQNDDALEAWKTGAARCAVNMNSLTTGVDHPPCDFIIGLRSTMSTGLWVQMLGRGTRPYDPETAEPWLAAAFPEAKVDCLVADYAGNSARLGPINDPVIPRARGKGAPGDAPIKTCPKCGVYNHTSARVCVACGEEFKFDVGISGKAGTTEVMRSDLPQIEPWKVDRVLLVAHTSRATGRAMIRVAYYCGLRCFYEYISFETGGLFLKKSRDWLRQRYGEPWEGMTNAQVLSIAHQMRHPHTINVWINKQQPEIMSHEF